MKTILLALALALISPLAGAQDVNGVCTRTIRMLDGSPTFAYMYGCPQDTAKDDTVFIKKFVYDLGGRPLIYGLNMWALSDTFTLACALDASVNDTTWVAVDSVAVTAGTPGRYHKNVDLTLKRYPYWRLRFSTATTDLRGNTAVAGRFDMFIETNLHERF